VDSQICQISNEPGGNIVVRKSRLLPNVQLLVKDEWWSKGYEPRWIVVTYGRSLVSNDGGKFGLVSKDEAFKRIIEKKLYFGDVVTVNDLL
jgi:hypothetical protein